MEKGEGWNEATRVLNQVAGIQAVDSAEGGLDEPLWAADGLLMQPLGVALVNADPEQMRALTAAAEDPFRPIALVEPEREVAAISAPTEVVPLVDEATLTWGLQAVNANISTKTGKGMRVAVLDTGFDLTHPEFAGRSVSSRSFVQNEDVQDLHGHGTHCIGTSCGPRNPEQKPGYGVAYEAAIFAGKVLSNRGSGADGGILAGISWAIENGCRIVSMSLGAPTTPTSAYSRLFEEIAQRALLEGTLIIAAAGNESKRAQGHIAPVSHPANCPSIMSVGAIDSAMKVANFSCGTVGNIGAVDVVAPGVDVYSSWPVAKGGHARLQGTSMATPHVAGVAALIAEQTQARAWELWARLMQSAKRLPLLSTDVGAGLVQAP
ncbi:MAG TPA: S8 family serine peptidase [Actinophytocola sp.]|nr:S8 family serine peptidase [Actinophytocola sp.]